MTLSKLKSTFNPNYTHSYIAQDSRFYMHLGYAWINFAQFVISTHCLSNNYFNMRPNTRIDGTDFLLIRQDPKWLYGKTSASFTGRVAHIATIGALLTALCYYRFTFAKILFGLLTVTKLATNFKFKNDSTFQFQDISKNKIQDLSKQDINIQDQDGLTPLIFAIKSKLDSALTLKLLALHPDIHLKDKENQNALDHAVKNRLSNAICHLLEYKEDWFTEEEIRKAWNSLSIEANYFLIEKEDKTLNEQAIKKLIDALTFINEKKKNVLKADSLFNLTYTYTYFPPGTIWYKRLAYLWINLAQFVLSLHFLSYKTGIQPISRIYISEQSFTHKLITITLKKNEMLEVAKSFFGFEKNQEPQAQKQDLELQSNKTSHVDRKSTSFPNVRVHKRMSYEDFTQQYLDRKKDLENNAIQKNQQPHLDQKKQDLENNAIQKNQQPKTIDTLVENIWKRETSFKDIPKTINFDQFIETFLKPLRPYIEVLIEEQRAFYLCEFLNQFLNRNFMRLNLTNFKSNSDSNTFIKSLESYITSMSTSGYRKDPTQHDSNLKEILTKHLTSADPKAIKAISEENLKNLLESLKSLKDLNLFKPYLVSNLISNWENDILQCLQQEQTAPSIDDDIIKTMKIFIYTIQEEEAIKRWVFGKTSPSLLGRIAHIGSIGALVALGYAQLQVTIVLFAALVITKLASNFAFRADSQLVFNLIPDLKTFKKQLKDWSIKDRADKTIEFYNILENF